MYPWRPRHGDDPSRCQRVLTIALHLTPHNTTPDTASATKICGRDDDIAADGGSDKQSAGRDETGTVLRENYLELKMC